MSERGGSLRTARLACALGALLLASPPGRPESPPRSAAPLALEDAFEPSAFGVWPTRPAWSPDGRLTYVWDASGEGREESIWSLDPATGRREVLVPLAGLGRPGEMFLLTAYAWSPRGDSLLLLSEGDLYLLPLATHKLRRLTRTDADEEDPEFSPDGRRIAFVRAFDLYTLDVATGAETRLTRDGRRDEILNGVADWVYGEEIWLREPRAFWWSPDGSRLAYYRFDERPVGTFPLLNDAALDPEVVAQRYPRAGAANPRVTIGVADVATGRTARMSTGDPDAYLARLEWTPRGDAVAIERLSRDQKRLDLLRCGAAEGACSPLLTESSRTWINLGRDFRFLPDGRFLWGSERDGWRRLYLYAADGTRPRPATPAGWAVTALDAVATDGTWAFVTGFPTAGLGPIDRQVARLRLDPAGAPAVPDGWEVLTPEPGWHQALVSPRTGAWVHTWADANRPPRSEARPARGPAWPLPSLPPRLDPALLPQWEFVAIPGPDGSRLPARLLKPAGFDPARRYPVLVYQYGGPGSQVVDDDWSARGLWHKLMAQQGFAVLSVDDQASVFFGKAGEDRDYRRLGPTSLAGQLAGVDYLKTLPWVDPARLGLWGWSGGGTNTLYCVLSRPGVWRAAVAAAPVTDWRLYDSIWTERYLGTPQADPDGYRDSSPLTYAARLKDPLLLVHGLADDNVHPQNTFRLSRAFVQAGLPFEQAFYPGQRHHFGPFEMQHFYARAAEFFTRTLRPSAPP